MDSSAVFFPTLSYHKACLLIHMAQRAFSSLLIGNSTQSTQRLCILLKGHPHSLPPDGGAAGGGCVDGGCREFTCTFSKFSVTVLDAQMANYALPSFDSATEPTAEILKLTASLSLSLSVKVWVTPGLVNESRWVPFFYDVEKAILTWICGNYPGGLHRA